MFIMSHGEPVTMITIADTMSVVVVDGDGTLREFLSVERTPHEAIAMSLPLLQGPSFIVKTMLPQSLQVTATIHQQRRT